MENVIKQGYLKRGSSTEGGVLSGFLDKMSPRKWYMLVVRNRVPYLEQYERDVDVFSSTPNTAYDLSTCTSISRPMSSYTRSNTFVIVCPNELIELVAASREQMVDWCHALERTLHGLGVIKNEKEEHIYTFCPAVVNLVGRTKVKQGSDDEDENLDEAELGAVGGVPALPPPRQSGGYPSAVSRTLSEPASDRLTPPPLPAHPVLRPSSVGLAKPERIHSPSGSKAPPSPVSPSSLNPSATRPHSEPPPLPERPLSVNTDDPPPLPPGRPTVPITALQDRSLPPLPKPPPDIASPSLPINGSDSDDDEDDYSSDFVSGAFWEINRKIPVPGAVHAVLPPKSDASVGHSASGKDASAESDLCASGINAPYSEELDDGYFHLRTVQNLKNFSSLNETNSCDTDTDAEVSKRAAFAESEEEENSTRETEPKGWTEVNNASCLESVHSDTQWVSENSARADPESNNGAAVSESSQPGENFYAPFPGHSDNGPSASEKLKSNDDNSEPSVQVVHLKSVVNTSRQKHSGTSLPNNGLETDGMYACASEASSLHGSSAPPLPPRQESLPSWDDDIFPDAVRNNVAAAASNGCSVTDASPAEGAISRPIPQRRTIRTHSTSYPVSEYEPGRKPGQSTVSVAGVPPLPPPRKSLHSNPDQSVRSITNPPPLPARKAQSFHSHRQLSAPPLPADSSAGYQWSDMDSNSDQLSSHQPSSLSRQQSLGSGDGSENHLRQRMRLDRVHSIHSVVSLKQSQAEILQQEMDLPGVTVTVTSRAAQGIAVVDCDNTVCIAGWNQKDFPSLHGKFHIGDQLISISNIKITSATMALKMLKHPESNMVEMLLKRTPHAKVLAIRRVAEGQSIGIKRNGGTAEIQYVDPNGLAAENGLPLHAPGVVSGQARSNWMLTEINSRHLNLFFKDNEIEHRLNAVGREITVVVQPSDYIGELKKQLKKMKNYKNYIVQ